MKYKHLKLALCTLGAALVITPCVAAEPDVVARIDAALAKAAGYLVDKQSPDGAWRSETYGCFRDGPTLTPYIMSCLFFLSGNSGQTQQSFHRGVEYVLSMVDDDGNIRTGPHGLMFPVYTAASASRVVMLQERADRNKRAHAAWLAHLQAYRHTSSLGWTPEDPEYGGWGFSLDVPRKPAAGRFKPPFIESNLTATIFGIAALRSAKIPSDDPIWSDILIFVKKCQNFHDDPAESDPRFDDGGFFFGPGNTVENKAGVAGTDRFGRQRYHSYGSMTADGLRALLACGLAPSHPRVQAARAWLEQNFSITTNPGNFNEDREVLRQATYYYYLWAVAHAFTRLGLREVQTDCGGLNWAEPLANEVLDRQRPDGSWVNSFTDAKEDDPLVSTPWAAAALANCRHVLTTEGDLLAEGCPRPQNNTHNESFARVQKGETK